MLFKTFTGTSEREVLDLAKAELGEKLMILGLRRDRESAVGPDGRHAVILRVGASSRKGQAAGGTRAWRRPSTGVAARRLKGGNSWANRDQAQAAELFQLRRQMRSLKAQLRVLRSSPFMEPFDSLFDLLTEAGAPDHVAEQLIQRTEERVVGMNGEGAVDPVEALRVLKKQIGTLFLPATQKTRRRKQEMIAVVGPSGAGKTSLIVKLASHRAVYGRRRVGIISTDIFRAGANAGLRSIGKILSVPIIEARQVDDLPRAVKNLRSRDVILVDTPGRSPLSQGSLPDLQTQLAVLRPDQTLLVLSANMALEELWLFAGLYQGLHPTGMVITKLDETSKPGKVLGLMDETYPAVNYVTTGQSVPDSLALDVGQAIIERLPLLFGGA